MRKIVSFAITFICFLFFEANAENINVRVYAGSNISNILIEPHSGRYIIAADNEEFLFPTAGNVELNVQSSKIRIKIAGRDKGSFKNITFYTKDSIGILKFTPNQNAKLKREYEGDFSVSAAGTSIRIINKINTERYIAAVVQAEIYGKPDQLDIFKVQSVISRTWLLKNMGKHKNDGYNVCDGVHCQAYKNRCIRPEILQATQATHDEVMIDANGNLIETAFHSNSGGQTVNSEDFWQSAVPYLRSIVDTFSYGMKMSTWEKKMPKNEWLNYFKNTHKLDVKNKDISNELLNFRQDERKTRICNVPLRSVREDLKLRSTYFNVYDEGNEVLISGKGYGHGIGLSQEGAIRMVELGYPYHEILAFYYTGAKLKTPNGVYEPVIPAEKPAAEIETVVAEIEQIAVVEEPAKEPITKPAQEKKSSKKAKKKKEKEKKVLSYPEEDAEFEIIID